MDPEQRDPNTCAFVVRVNGIETWRAIWRGQLAAADFNSRGAARAYLDTCDRAGKLRA